MSTLINGAGCVLRDHDGPRGHLRGGEHHVQRGGEPRARDRDAARHGFRCGAGGRSRCCSRRCCWAPRVGLLGGVLAFIFLNGMQSSTMNFQTFSQITYAFTVTPQLMVTGIIYGLVLTFIAGVLPGIRAARMPITSGSARVVMRFRRVAIRLARWSSMWAGASSPGLRSARPSIGRTSKGASSMRTTPTTRARLNSVLNFAQAEGGRG